MEEAERAESCGGDIPTSASSRSMANSSETKSDCSVPTMREDMEDEDEDEDEDDAEEGGGEKEEGVVDKAAAAAEPSTPAVALSVESPWRLHKYKAFRIQRAPKAQT